ncbi:MAG: NAD(P)H-hydrate dehydratase [Actinomycetota bacterium]
MDPHERNLPPAHLVIDGAYGTGLNRPYDFATTAAPVLAIDIPSGVDGRTGSLHGRAPFAAHTITFAALKPGLLLTPGAGRTGHIEVADVGLDVTSARAWLFTGDDAAEHLPRRADHAHKWNNAVMVVGGSPGMNGAPILAAEAALRSGCGLVRCGLVGGATTTPGSPVVFEELPASAWSGPVLDRLGEGRFRSLVIGPGLAPDTHSDTQAVLTGSSDLPTVVDGTALRLLGLRPNTGSNVVLTPHDGEFLSLAGAPPDLDRFASARALASDTGSVVLLKGPCTIVAAPDGRCLAVAHGDSRLATAGSGDVLSGAIATQLASGVEPFLAAALGAWLHADAGHRLPLVGGVASDLVELLADSASALAVHGGHRAPN